MERLKRASSASKGARNLSEDRFRALACAAVRHNPNVIRAEHKDPPCCVRRQPLMAQPACQPGFRHLTGRAGGPPLPHGQAASPKPVKSPVSQPLFSEHAPASAQPTVETARQRVCGRPLQTPLGRLKQARGYQRGMVVQDGDLRLLA